MARKTKDLFQLLQRRRSKGSFKVKPDPEVAEPVDVLGVVGGWFGGLLGHNSRPRRRSAKRRMAGRPVGIMISGPALCGLAFASLVVGFLLGQTLSSSGAAELRVPKVEPQWLSGPDGAPGELAPHVQIQQLGEYAYLLGQYPIGADPDASRNQAERLATYLRAGGLQRTRIYKHWGTTGSNLWLTLCYTAGHEVDQAVLDRLNTVAPPPFEPGWPQILARLEQDPKPVRLTPPAK